MLCGWLSTGIVYNSLEISHRNLCWRTNQGTAPITKYSSSCNNLEAHKKRTTYYNVMKAYIELLQRSMSYYIIILIHCRNDTFNFTDTCKGLSVKYVTLFMANFYTPPLSQTATYLAPSALNYVTLSNYSN